MEPEELKKITQSAQEAVKDLEPELKKGAFDTILNRLLENKLGSPRETGQSTRKPRASKQRVPKAAQPTEFSKTTKNIMETINATKHPLMFKLKLTLDRAIYLLKIVKDEVSVDGLTPIQIAQVLTEKFRLKATQNAVSMALMKNLNLVDRRPVSTGGASAYTYHIMHQGEEYLNRILSEAKKEKVANAEQ